MALTVVLITDFTADICAALLATDHYYVIIRTLLEPDSQTLS